MNINNKLAIVIPFYKIDFCKKTLQSISAQNDKRFTLYIGNDNSSSDPIRLIESLLSRVKYMYIPYLGKVDGSNLAKQWEEVLEKVIEEWFQRLGDGNFITANFTATKVRHLDGTVNLPLLRKIRIFFNSSLAAKIKKEKTILKDALRYFTPNKIIDFIKKTLKV